MLHRITTFFCLLLIILGSSWSLFNSNFFRVHDFTHAARISEMARAIQDGHIVPRWSQNFGFGYGMPLFEFYAPAPYYLGAILFMLGLPMILVLKALFLVANVGTAIGSYKLGKSLFGTTYAWLVAASITLAPYRAVNLYVRGALSEAWGIMMLPWIFYGTLLIFKNQRKGFFITTISIVLLFLSHNLTSMIAIVSIAAFALFSVILRYLELSKNTKKISIKPILTELVKPIGLFIASGLLALAITAYYVFPALLEKDFTRVEETVINNYFDFRLHFLYLRQFFEDSWGYGGSSWGVDDDISFYLGTSQLVSTFLTVISIFILTLRSWQDKSINFYKKSVITLSLISLCLVFVNTLMTTQKTLFIWEAITPFHFIQFPWRWMSALIIWIGLFGSLFIITIKNAFIRTSLAIFLVLLSVAFNSQFFKPEKYLDIFEGSYYTDASRISREMSQTLYDYMPKVVPLNIQPPESFISCEIEKPTFEENCAQTAMVSNKTHYKQFTTSMEREAPVVVALADYPGWRVRLDNQLIDHTTSKMGLIQFIVPTGNHTITLEFTQTQIRLVSDWISGISFIILISLYIKNYKEEENKHV